MAILNMPYVHRNSKSNTHNNLPDHDCRLRKGALPPLVSRERLGYIRETTPGVQWMGAISGFGPVAVGIANPMLTRTEYSNASSREETQISGRKLSQMS